MGDNLAQQDQGGSNCQYVRTWLGPTLGWAMLPVMAEMVVTVGGTLTLSPYTSRVLLKIASPSIILPLVKKWVSANPIQGNQSGFDRSIWIKDLGYNASGISPIVVSPTSPDTIDGLASFTIITPGSIIRLYPLTSLDGWYVG